MLIHASVTGFWFKTAQRATYSLSAAPAPEQVSNEGALNQTKGKDALTVQAAGRIEEQGLICTCRVIVCVCVSVMSCSTPRRDVLLSTDF